MSPGTYTVIVVCSNGSTAGSQSVIVSSVPSTPTPAADGARPTRGVMGGVGGGSKDYGTGTMVAGGVLVVHGADRGGLVPAPAAARARTGL
ncbi:Secreted protein OS=Streptomyces glaucescens OX=1907 GN=SGLAU_03180 PE=4 SV=1 [Streptomyces glaucescens]